MWYPTGGLCKVKGGRQTEVGGMDVLQFQKNISQKSVAGGSKGEWRGEVDFDSASPQGFEDQS